MQEASICLTLIIILLGLIYLLINCISSGQELNKSGTVIISTIMCIMCIAIVIGLTIRCVQILQARA